MLISNKVLLTLLVLALISAGCNMPAIGDGNGEANGNIPPPPPVPLRPPAPDLNGTWQGSTLDASSGITYNTSLEITQEVDSNEFFGSILFTDPNNPNFSENYLITGIVAGNAIHFHDRGTEVITHYFWGIVVGDVINAQISLNCYDCGDSYGTITLSR